MTNKEALKILQNLDGGLVNINTMEECRLLKLQQKNLNKQEAWNNNHARTDFKNITPCSPSTGFAEEYVITFTMLYGNKLKPANVTEIKQNKWL